MNRRQTPRRAKSRDCGSLPVYVASMCDLDDNDKKDVVADLVDDAVGTLADAIELRRRGLLCAMRARIIGQSIDALEDSADVISGNGTQVLGDGPFELDPIACHAP